MTDIAVFLSQCLPLSEIFVYHQASALTRYKPTFVACKKVDSGINTTIPEVILNQRNSVPERLKELLFKATGHAPELDAAMQGKKLIHAHFGPTGFLAMPLAARAGIPLVVTLHGFDVLKNTITLKDDGLMQTLYGKKRHKLAAAASNFICVSEYTKKRAIAFGFPESKCTVHYMGIPLIPHNEPKYVRNDNTPFRLLAVGRMVPFKGHTHLISAVAALQQQGLDIQLDIVGDGPLRAALEQQASTLEHCTFHGAQPHDRVLQLMRQSELFCHTSLHQPNGQTEAFGLVLLEAQWAGLPVVAFNSGGVPEAFSEGVTGLGCAEGDVEAFVKAVKALAQRPERLRAMSAAAPEFVRRNFDNSIQTAKLETLYDRLS